MARPRFLLSLLAATIAGAVPGALPAQQMSESYTFLKNVRDRDGAAVTEAIARPGSRLIDSRDRTSGETALDIVIDRRDATWLGFLLSKGADPNQRGRDNDPPILRTTTLGFDDGTRLLLASKANPNSSNSRGETALIRAVQRRDLPMVRLLLQNGADPDQADVIAGKSARDYAARDDRAPAIAKLFAETPAKQRRAVAGPRL